MNQAGFDRCQFLFTDLLQKTQHGSVPTGPCIAAAEAGGFVVWPRSYRLRDALQEIADEEDTFNYGHKLPEIARKALLG